MLSENQITMLLELVDHTIDSEISTISNLESKEVPALQERITQLYLLANDLKCLASKSSPKATTPEPSPQ